MTSEVHGQKNVEVAEIDIERWSATIGKGRRIKAQLNVITALH